MWPWKKLKEGFAGLRARLEAAFAKGDKDTLEEILVEADVGVERARELISLSNGRRERLVELISEILGKAERTLDTSKRPTVIMLAGTNGSGKTTTTAKLALLLKEKRVLVAAADTYRDAAGLQLERWAQRIETDLVTSTKGQDAGAVVWDTLSKATSKYYGVVLLDTAGRLHTRRDLMDEAQKIRRVCEKKIPGSPHEVLLVIDASTGQNGLRQAEEFTKALGVTGLIITKLDGTSKAGIIIPIVQKLDLPVYFAGIGEQPEDLVPFSADEFVRALLD